jgi:hypothetical protein
MSELNQMTIISSYTTSEAVADGVLIRIQTNASKEAGIVYPVYMSSAVWERYVKVPEGMEADQDLSGRLWDILWMFRIAAQNFSGSLMKFQFISVFPNRLNLDSNEEIDEFNYRTVTLKAVITAQDIDDPSPAIFIMKPDED